MEEVSSRRTKPQDSEEITAHPITTSPDVLKANPSNKQKLDTSKNIQVQKQNGHHKEQNGHHKEQNGGHHKEQNGGHHKEQTAGYQETINNLKDKFNLEDKKRKAEQYQELVVEKMKNYRTRNMLIGLLALLTLFVAVWASRSSYNPKEPSTWSLHQLKEWLADHRIDYEGIPEKHDLLELVNSNWDDAKTDASTSAGAVQDFVRRYIEYVKDKYTNAQEVTADEMDDFVTEIADSIDTLRHTTGLTEDQISSTFNEIKKQLATTKSKGNEAISSSLDSISNTYSGAQAKRDEITKEAFNRIANDYKNSKKLSKDTVNWFKDQINEMSNTAGFAKARTQTQVTLILGDLREKLIASKNISADEIGSTYDQLTSSVEDYYKSAEGTLSRMRHEIQSALDQFSRKIGEGKNVTVEQFAEIAKTINRYLFNPVKDAYQSTSDQVRDTSSQVRDAGQDQLNNIIDGVKNAFTTRKRKGKMEEVIDTLEQQITDTQHLTREQTNILQETIKEKFEGVKDARDLTEAKISEFLDALRNRLASARDATKDTAKSGVKKAADKVQDSAEYVKDSAQYVKEEL
ncbi:hypothetical protein G9A89_019626 [Geosiphon pyriformis]|nr:hypothetical protein G9A89_019626 [Geosiphon pyriformis]